MFLDTQCHGTYVDGALYWVCVHQTVDSGFRNLIIAYDLATEEYRVLQTPVYQHISSKVGIRMGSVEHSNSLWAHYYPCQPLQSICHESVMIVGQWLLHQRDG